MLRLRVSDLDAYRDMFMEDDDGQTRVTQESLIESMAGVQRESPRMAVGKALHEGLERAVTGKYEIFTHGNWTFDFVRAKCECPVLLLPHKEVPVEKIYQTELGPVLLVGRIDARGKAYGVDSAVDYKVRMGRPDDLADIAETYQWRAYLDMSGALSFYHYFFEGELTGQGYVFIHRVHRFQQWTYPEIEEDVRRLVGEVARFKADHLTEIVALRIAGTQNFTQVTT